MFLLDSDAQLDCVSDLLEAGDEVNSCGDHIHQSPAHVAAYGGQAFCLLRTGADPNQQDHYGETPVHKAVRAGSLECISLLVAREARLDLCNHEGRTACDLAWSGGFQRRASFLENLQASQSHNQSTLHEVSSEKVSPRFSLAGQKRPCLSPAMVEKKKARNWCGGEP